MVAVRRGGVWRLPRSYWINLPGKFRINGKGYMASREYGIASGPFGASVFTRSPAAQWGRPDRTRRMWVSLSLCRYVFAAATTEYLCPSLSQHPTCPSTSAWAWQSCAARSHHHGVRGALITSHGGMRFTFSSTWHSIPGLFPPRRSWLLETDQRRSS